MTITDLKKYKAQMEAEINPDDKFVVELTREAMIYFRALAYDRYKKLTQALNATNICDRKREKRKMEYQMVESMIECLDSAKRKK